MKQITKNVFVETGYPICNLGLVTTDNGIVMIDTPIFPSDALKWRTDINKMGKLRYVINTEPHADHSRNSYFFEGVQVAHQVTRNLLATVSTEEITQFVKQNDPEGLPLIENFKVRLPDIAFEGNLNLYLGHHTFKLIHLPGHTTGQIGVYIPEERVVFTADCVVYHCKSWLHEALPYHWIESLQKLSQLDVDVVIPGHGGGVPACKKEYLKEQSLIIKRWIEVVKSAIEKGLSKEEAFAKTVCPDPYPIVGLTPLNDAELNKAIIARLYHVLARENVS